jgi:hypothetical protein
MKSNEANGKMVVLIEQPVRIRSLIGMGNG